MSTFLVWAAMALSSLSGGQAASCGACDACACCGCCEGGSCTCTECGCECREAGASKAEGCCTVSVPLGPSSPVAAAAVAASKTGR